MKDFLYFLPEVLISLFLLMLILGATTVIVFLTYKEVNIFLIKKRMGYYENAFKKEMERND